MAGLTRRGAPIDRPHRSAWLAGVAILALATAACGPSATAAPGGESAAPGSSVGPGASLPAGPTGGPGETPGGATGEGPFAAASTALDALDSYTFRVEVNSTSVSGSETTSDHSIFSGVVVNKPAKASSLDMQTLDAAGTVTDESTFVVIGSQAWTSDSGPSGPWTEIPAAAADAFIQSMAAFRPEQMFGLYFAGIGGDFHAVGTETKNGVATTRYQGDEAVGALLGAIAGVQGSWTSDVWIANDGGFLVHSEAGAQGSSGGEGGSFSIIVDITSPNASGPITPPAT
jgi:hypothetical protein